MKIRGNISVLFLVSSFFIAAAICRLGAQVVVSTNSQDTIKFELPSAAEAENDISNKTDSSTQRLIQTLEALKSQDLYYNCGVGLEKMTREEKLKGPIKDDTFEKIVNELADRGGDLVRQAFEIVLVEEKLDASEKSVVRTRFRNRYGQDAPFTLPATDRKQTRQLLLRFDPQKTCP